MDIFVDRDCDEECDERVTNGDERRHGALLSFHLWICQKSRNEMLSLQQSNVNGGQMQSQSSQDIQNAHLHDPNAIPPAPRTSRKRKTPPTNPDPNTLPNLQHMMHPMAGLPAGYQYNTDFSTAGMPPPNSAPPQDDAGSQSPPANSSGRSLSNSKRAEQNRKAQRAFRERRDQ